MSDSDIERPLGEQAGDPTSAHHSDHAAGDAVGGASELVAALSESWNALVRHRRIFFQVFAGVAVLVVIGSFAWPATYAATTALLIQESRHTAGLGSGGETAQLLTTGVSEAQVVSEIAVLTSREVIQQTMEDTGLNEIQLPLWTRLLFGPIWIYEDLHASYHGIPRRDKIERLRTGIISQLTVERLKDSNILVATFESGNPLFAEAFLGQLISNYLDHHVEVHSQPLVQRFFTEQVDTLRVELSEKEDTLQELEASLGVSDIDTQQLLQIDTVDDLMREMTKLDRDLAEIGERVVSISAEIFSAPQQVQTSTTATRNELVLQNLKEQALHLELELVRLRERYSAGSPLLVEVTKKLETTQEAIAREAMVHGSESTTGISPTVLALRQRLVEARVEYSSLKERRATLAQQLTAAHERLGELDNAARQATELKRHIGTIETQYLLYLKRQTEAAIDQALDQNKIANATVVQAAAANMKPVRPKKLMTIAAALAGGLVAALGCVVGLEVKEGGLEGFLGSLAPGTETG